MNDRYVQIFGKNNIIDTGKKGLKWAKYMNIMLMSANIDIL